MCEAGAAATGGEPDTCEGAPSDALEEEGVAGGGAAGGGVELRVTVEGVSVTGGCGKGRKVFTEGGRASLGRFAMGGSSPATGDFLGPESGVILGREGRAGGTGVEPYCPEFERFKAPVEGIRGGIAGRLGALEGVENVSEPFVVSIVVAGTICWALPIASAMVAPSAPTCSCPGELIETKSQNNEKTQKFGFS